MQLYEHQREGVAFLKDCGALYFEAGLGKTLTALEYFKKLRSVEPTITSTVICPLMLIQNAWIEEIKKFTTYTCVDMHDKKNKDAQADIYLFNYEMMLRKENVEKVKRLGGLCILDESSKIKNHAAAITKSILTVRDSYRYRIIMSGTPAPNNESEYWAQMRFLSDDIFPKSFYAFRNMYFHLQRGKQVIDIPNGSFMTREMARKMFSTGFQYAITEEKRKALMDKMRPYVMFRKLSECVDLPPQVEVKRIFTLKKEQANVYKMMKTQLVAELSGEVIMAQYALTKISKLRQITSGFLLNSEGNAIDLEQNAKLDELKELLEEIGSHQVIIWTWFVHEAEVIRKVLGDKARIINGTISNDDKTQNISDFKEGKFQYLIANPQSIAHGVTMTNCHYVIYYSLSYSWEQLSQSMSRIYRISQKESCIYYYLLADNTIDEIMLGVLKRKGTEDDIIKEALK